MWWYRHGVLIATVSAVVTTSSAGAQRPDGMRGMGMAGMMGQRDSTTMTLMASSHQLVMNHELVTRTVANLPNGVRTVTESDDPRIAALIKEHVGTTVARVDKGSDPGLPIESPALRTIFKKGASIRTTTTATEKGVVVVQTSDDPAAIIALQTHASEVSDLVAGGMAAMHAAMMKNGAMPRMRGPDTTAAPRYLR